MTGRELIEWLEENDALDLEIVADCGAEIAGDTMTRLIFPEIHETSGRGIIGEEGTVYTVMTGDSDDVVVL